MRGALLLVIASACAPTTPHNGSCLFWEDCGEGGACEYSKLHSDMPFRGECSFPDDSCETGRRFGELGTAGVAGTCVEFSPGLDGRCDEAHPCTGAFDCQLGRCINVRQLDATGQLTSAVCADDPAKLRGGDLYFWGIFFLQGEPSLFLPNQVWGDALPPVMPGVGIGMPAQTINASAGANLVCITGTDQLGMPISGCLGREGNPALGPLGPSPAPFGDWFYPTPPIGSYTSISASVSHTCGMSADSVVCWGLDDQGQLDGVDTVGTIVGATRDVPGVTAVTTGDNFSCAASGDIVSCWGGGPTKNNWAAGTFRDETTGEIALDARPVVALAAGGKHACAIQGEDRQLSCWGGDDDGEVDGTPSTTPVPPSKPLGDLHVLTVATGAHHSCAVLEDHAVMCWGSSVDGKLGTPEGGSAPRTVPFDRRAVGPIATTDFSTCAVLEDMMVHCWGAPDLTTDVAVGDTFTLAQFPICLF